MIVVVRLKRIKKFNQITTALTKMNGQTECNYLCVRVCVCVHWKTSVRSMSIIFSCNYLTFRFACAFICGHSLHCKCSRNNYALLSINVENHWFWCWIKWSVICNICVRACVYIDRQDLTKTKEHHQKPINYCSSFCCVQVCTTIHCHYHLLSMNDKFNLFCCTS